MSVFYNGSLIVSPATVSAVNDSAMANQNLAVGNVLALLGTSVGGQPNTPLTFGSPAQAAAVLQGGDLLKAVQLAFNASSEVGSPTSVVAVRVSAATPSTTTLNSASTPVVTLTSRDAGLYTANIAVKIEAGTTLGKKITTQLGSAVATADNVHRNAIRVTYTGAETTATISVTETQVFLNAPAGTVVATIDLNAFPSVDLLAQRINATGLFTATVLDGNEDAPALSGLDTVTAQDVKSAPFELPANLQAVIDWFNDAPGSIITATRLSAGLVPDNIPFTYLAGGSDGTVTSTDYANGYTALQTVDVQWVVPLTTDPSVHAMNDAHCAFMSNVARRERRGIVGAPMATSDPTAIGLAKNLNSDRTSLVHLGIYDYDEDGDLVLYPPYFLAAIIAGAFCGANPGTALTNKSLKIRGLERNLRNPTDTDALIIGGVMPVESTPRGYRVVKSISTWLTNTNYNRVEQSVGVAVDYTARSVRDALDIYRGAKATPQLLGQIVNTTDTILRELSRPEPTGPGVLAGDKNSPPYLGISASVVGDVVNVQFQCSPVLVANYILVSIFAVPYSGTATL